MPAVSRERVSSLLNFIVHLASHIWVLESLGGFGGREGWLLQPLWSWKLPPHPGSCVWGGLGSSRSEAGGGGGRPSPSWGAPFRFWAPGGAAGGGGAGASVGILLLKHKNKSSRPAHTGVL